ncbi:hypothetical protein BDY24DRAFT_442970 [Mrakia frigida]|uniref:uncharacterized protein n=1 Tax=Mrakia frigida TaxID=29902 RepID=UPI003FCC0BED
MTLPPSSSTSSGSSSLPFSLHLTLLSHALASYHTSTSPSLFGNQPYPNFPRSRNEDSDDEGGELDEGGRSLGDRARQLGEFARWWIDVKHARSMDIMERRVCAMVDSFTSHGLILLLHSLSPYQLPLLLPTLLLPLPFAFIPRTRSSSCPLKQTSRRRTLLILLFQLPPLLLLSLLLSEIQRTTVLYILQLLRTRSSPNRRSSVPLRRLTLKGAPLPLPPPLDASSAVCAICVSSPTGDLELFCPSGGHAYHKRCIKRWLKVYNRGRREEGDEGSRVALVQQSSSLDEEEGAALPLEEEERSSISSLLRRDLGLRMERSAPPHQHHSHPHLFPPPPPSPSPSNQPTLLLASPPPLTTSSQASFLGTLTTSYPPCPTCRSPLVFQLHLSPPTPPPSKSKGSLSGWRTTWSEFVSGETMLKERGGMQVGALAVVVGMGWLRGRRAGGV